jgi:hypothetical protein
MASGVNFGTQQYFGFDPRTIPGCCLWLDAADARTLTTSGGGNVTQWADKSGLGANMTPFGTNSNATIQTNYQNGLSALNFSGLNQYQTPANTGVYPSDVYILVALKSLTRMDVISIGPTNADNFNSLTFAEYQSLRWHNGSSSFARTPATVSSTDETSTSLLIMNWSLANNNFIIRRNGTQLSSTSAYTYAPSAGAVIQIGFRHQNFGTNLAFNAYVGEVLTFDRQLVIAERQQVEGYLAWKWALQANLPATHPFKLTPPIMRIFQPMDVSGASLWLDAADPSTLSFSGPNVTQWRDKSGTGNHYATGGAITYSNQALVFPGNATMSNTNPINFSAGTTPSMTTFVVVSTPDGSAERGIFQYGQISCSKTGYAIYVYTPSEVHCTLYCGDLMVRNAITTNTRMMVADVVTYSGTPGSLSRAGWINGAAMTTTNVTTTGVNLNLASSSVIGNVAGGFWNGTMNEILYFNRALSTAERQEIEGYLATKWNLPVRVPTTHPFRNVLPSTPLFSPPQLSGLSLWIDAADATTFTLSGSNVTQCTDKSGQGYVLTVPGGYTSPVYSNGVLAMSGSNALWSTTNFAVSGNTQVTTFLVGSITSIGNPGPGAHIGLAGSATPPQYFGVLAYQDGGQTILYTPSCFGPDADRTLTPNINGQRYLLCAFYNGTVIQGTYNGTLGTSQSLTTANFASRPFQIGMRNANTGGANDGTICESICYTGALTASQRQQVEGYLAWKWGLQARLPSTHPFAKFRP